MQAVHHIIVYRKWPVQMQHDSIDADLRSFHFSYQLSHFARQRVDKLALVCNLLNAGRLLPQLPVELQELGRDSSYDFMWDM